MVLDASFVSQEKAIRSEVSVVFKGHAPIRVDLNEIQPMPPDVARWWLDVQFTRMACEPLRPTGKLLTADKVVIVAQAAGFTRSTEVEWSQEFARATVSALGKPLVYVDVDSLSISY